MAFKDCFYVKALSGVFPAVGLMQEDFENYNIRWQYGIEKEDGSEPDWQEIYVPEESQSFVDLPIGKKVYLKGNGTPHTYNPITREEHHTGNAYPMFSRSDCFYEIGGSLQSLLWDGDGSNPDPKFLSDGNTYYSYSYWLHSNEIGKDDFDLTNLIITPAKVKEQYYLFFKNTSFTKLPKVLIPNGEPVESGYAYMLQETPNLVALPKGAIKINSLENKLCLGWLLRGCTNLNEIWVEFKDWGPESAKATNEWVTDVAPIGTFHCPESLPQIFDDSHIPVGWAVITFPDPKPPEQQPISVTICGARPRGGRKL